MAEYRPIPDDDEDDRRRITSYAFGAGSGPYDPEEEIDERRQRRWDFGEDRGMYDGDDLLVCCTRVEFATRVRGTELPLAGMTAVASPPEHRRQGLVGDLIEASLAEYRDREWPLSALHPFDEAFYRRYGWATGCRYRKATVDPGALSSVPVEQSGEFRRVDPDDFDRIAPVYEARREGIDLALDRTDDWWRDRVFQGFENELHCYAWERDGQPRSYVVYDVTDGDGGRRLETKDVAFRDHEAFLHLLRFCHNHDSQVSEVALFDPGADRLVDLVDDRDALTVEEAASTMVRIVDVPAALEAVPYPGVEAADLVLAVTDDHAPWNDATFAVEVRDGEATVAELEPSADATVTDPDATLDVGALSQLLVGYRRPDRLRVEGDLTVHDQEGIDTLETLFPERECWLPDHF